MVGTGPAISIAARLWDAGVPRYQRWKTSRRVENRVVINLEFCDLHIDAADKGHVSFNLGFANFSKRVLSVDHVEIDSWRFGTNHLNVQSSFIKASGGIGANSAGKGYFAVALQSGDIGEITKGIGLANNKKSSPQAYLEIRGVVVFVANVNTFRVPFKFEGNNPRVSIPTSMAE